MKIGAVLPHNEIGSDPGAIKAYLQGVEELGMTHLLIYDHVMGADPDRWTTHADFRREIGATDLAVATHNAGETDVDGHLTRIAQCRDATSD